MKSLKGKEKDVFIDFLIECLPIKKKIFESCNSRRNAEFGDSYDIRKSCDNVKLFNTYSEYNNIKNSYDLKTKFSILIWFDNLFDFKIDFFEWNGNGRRLYIISTRELIERIIRESIEKGLINLLIANKKENKNV